MFTKKETIGFLAILFIVICTFIFAECFRNSKPTIRRLASKEILQKIDSLNKVYPQKTLSNSAQQSVDQQAKKGVIIKIQPMDLNSADSLDLIKIKGIGPRYASRILKYRKLLGGYTSLNQLSEVYGLKSRIRTIQNMREHFNIDISNNKKININQITLTTLPYHPYLKDKHWHAIISYRESHGKFASCNDLKNIVIMDKEDINKICNYLAF